MLRSMQLNFAGVVLIVAGMGLAQAQQQESTSTQNPPATPSHSAPVAASKADTPAPGDFARLRVYRHRKYAGSALAPSIFVDDKPVARIGNGRRVSIKLSPGAHSVRSDDKSSAISVDAKAGQEYYVRVDEEAGFWKGHGKLTMLMPEQGSAEYKLQKPLEGDRRLDKEAIEEDAETPAK
jgi:hypothetical protein